ncbi:MAG: LytR C-terminal domain-containing protein [Ilumatobacter sp.]|jgi:hypothetical protein|uniref:LytR C-terminal domain-containing protein n=1 Tax=Ilumatobacter sp. TaxID=1967498 RepID=UPI00391CAA34
MSNEESMAAAAVASRRVPRQGVGGSPIGSTLSIVLALVAVVAGFLILQNITDEGGTAAVPETGTDITATTLPDGTATTLPSDASTTTTTTTIPRITDGATVGVANANTVGGSAGQMTRTLEIAGYAVTDPVNATGPNVDDSIVYYDATVAAAQDVANSVANDLGGLAVLPAPTPVPTESATLGGAGVLVMLGNNEAGKSLEELAPVADAADAASTVEAPPVAGTDDAVTGETGTGDAVTDEESGE